MNFSIVIPTLNAGDRWQEVIDSILLQSIKPHIVYVVDSESEDETFNKAEAAGFKVRKIAQKTFDHGGTRQMCVNALTGTDVVVFLTHDAVMADKNALKNLLSTFDDSSIGVAYGRQLPRKQANGIEAHARLFNYPDKSRIKNINDRDKLGFKTVFVSNSFAAYRYAALEEVGGFPERAILSEDTCVVAKMLMKGWKLAYCAEAQVDHSHDFSYLEEFQRYFDIGVFHTRESWIRDQFGNINGEGKRFVVSEIKYLLKESPLLIPSSIFRSVLKMAAYRLGRRENSLPVKIKKGLSMNKTYWDKESEERIIVKSSVSKDSCVVHLNGKKQIQQ